MAIMNAINIPYGNVLAITNLVMNALGKIMGKTRCVAGANACASGK